MSGHLHRCHNSTRTVTQEVQKIYINFMLAEVFACISHRINGHYKLVQFEYCGTIKYKLSFKCSELDKFVNFGNSSGVMSSFE